MLKKLFVLSAVSVLVICLHAAPGRAQSPAPAAGEHIPTSHGGDLVVHTMKHATLALTWNGKTVYVDPAPWPVGKGVDGSLAFAGLPAPDLIVITHLHPDHFDAATLTKLVTAKTVVVVTQSIADTMPPDLKAKARVLDNGKSTDVATIHVEAVPSYNITPERLKNHPQGRDNGYVLTFGGKRVYIAGDTEDTPEMRALKNIDVAFIPMNPPYTMSPERAADAVRTFKPKIVYPYHYHGSDVAAFASAVGPGVEVRQRDWY
jgi:L-ascorbate metabolism protein UlaG (beta-lactamase superfamily)